MSDAPTTLRVLFVEDDEDDALLQLREMRRHGLSVDWRRVDTSDAFRDALFGEAWDVIISDYSLPSFTGLDALRVVRESGRDVPFVLISGTVGEEVAVESMKAGAADYLLKDNLTRLVPAVRRELREVAHRRRRREAERELRESQALLSLIVDHASEMLVLFCRAADGEYRTAAANRAFGRFARRLGAADAAVERATLGDLLRLLSATPDEARALEDGMHRAVFDRAGATFDLLWRRGDLAVPTDQHFVPIGDEAPPKYVLWTALDVGERLAAEDHRRRLEGQLMQAQKLEALGTLAAGIAHDFNNILAGLSGYVELVRGDAAGRPDIQANMTLIAQGISRATDLCRRILSFGRRQSEHAPVTLEAVVRESLQFIRPLVPSGVRVVTDFADDCPATLGDLGQIQQAVLNLCTNALSAMRSTGGTLAVALRREAVGDDFARAHPPLEPGPHAVLRVADGGTGMDAATLARLFEPFFTTKPLGEGTGLGMVIVQSVVRSHHGAIDVQSAPGEGTRFDLFFPACAGPPAPPLTPTVLLLQSEPYLAHMAGAMVSRMGLAARTMADAGELLETLDDAEQAADVLVIDLELSSGPGLPVALEARRRRPRLAVLLTTGPGNDAAVRRARAAGFEEFLEKPFTLERLREKLGR